MRHLSREAVHPEDLSSASKTHRTEGKNWLFQAVLWPAWWHKRILPLHANN